jgi:hypothetical protein
MPEDLDTSNKFLVGSSSHGEIQIHSTYPTKSMTKDEALILAAWLVALADPSGTRFPEVLRKVMET